MRVKELNIFLVEDSSVIRDNLIEALRENSSVRIAGVAEDADTAIDWLENHAAECDLVIIDIFLKSGSGIGVLQALAGQAGSPRRMVLSNHATREIRDKCAELGAEKVFDKSNEIDEMIAYCNRLASSRVTAG